MIVVSPPPLPQEPTGGIIDTTGKLTEAEVAFLAQKRRQFPGMTASQILSEGGNPLVPATRVSGAEQQWPEMIPAQFIGFGLAGKAAGLATKAALKSGARNALAEATWGLSEAGPAARGIGNIVQKKMD